MDAIYLLIVANVIERSSKLDFIGIDIALQYKSLKYLTKKLYTLGKHDRILHKFFSYRRPEDS